MLIRKLYLFVTMIFYYLPVYASDVPAQHKAIARRAFIPEKKESGIADIAANLFGFTKDIGQLFKVLAITTGVALVLFGIVQYNKHRKNPVETPISNVIMTIVIGLGLVALSFIPMKA